MKKMFIQMNQMFIKLFEPNAPFNEHNVQSMNKMFINYIWNVLDGHKSIQNMTEGGKDVSP